MKKIISILLTAALLIGLAVPSFASAGDCDCGVSPLVYVAGFGQPLYLDVNTDSEKRVFVPEGEFFVKAIPELAAAIFGLVSGNFEMFGTYAIKAADIIIGLMECDENGFPKYNVGIKTDPAPSGNLSHNHDKEFQFEYDWRLSSVDNVKLLKAYIEKVKECTHHDKVTIKCHSQGNTLLTTYLSEYSYSDFDKIICLSPAYQGLSLVESLFLGDYELASKSQEISDFVGSLLAKDAVGNLAGSSISLLAKYGAISPLLGFLQELLDDQYERVFDEFLARVFGTMPGIWSFVPYDSYDQAKQNVFGDNQEEYAELIKKIDYYHYNVQPNTEKLLRQAKDAGTALVITSGYGIPNVPVETSAPQHTDFLIDTKYMSLGATCAPCGEKLDAQGEYVSPDGEIDASTAAFPECTWFFKYQDHNKFTDGYEEFIEWAHTFKGQPTVKSDSRYPQFMTNDLDGNLIPVSGEEDTRSDIQIIIDALIILVPQLFEKIKGLF